MEDLTGFEIELLIHALDLLDDAIFNNPDEYSSEERDTWVSLTTKLRSGGIGLI